MQGSLRRAATAPRRSVPEIPKEMPVFLDNDEWAQSELSSYFKLHPEKLSSQLDRIMDKLRESQGDMQTFILQLDRMIDELNADIDKERRGVAGRDRLMRDYPDVTNEFLHFFLDGIMEAMENEQQAPGSSGSGGGASTAGAGQHFRGSGGPLLAGGGGGGVMRPRSSGSSGSSKERFSGVAKRMQA
ncbi:hypothetical protein PLESTB_001561600 [Pleodorina starrii]|uniref:Uncharacterized protein n=1 Tax=Pleodorina starrii TaxID=330485 RepID=A0A9W6BY58_9CHLO|nr:hypothetical protein PLESTM_001477800 [Pleodorina starrii]GLC59992.1 hypothetical protein PLESTB_001561600 [Pleodorina starrii]GLC72780.1 hypothetical protein PLESTF_001292400 [Pleodorina starrii]